LKGEGRKGMQRMPRWQVAKKGVASCEKPGGAARERRYRIPEWGNLHGSNPMRVRAIPGEVKHLSTRRRRNQTRFPK